MPRLASVRPPQPQKVAWRVSEFCQALGISKATLYRQMKAGKIRFVHVGTSRKIITTPQEFIAALENAQNAA